MERTKLVRGLRIAWSVWCGILCVLLVLLWVRSYWWSNALVIHAFGGRLLEVSSDSGRVVTMAQGPDATTHWSVSITKFDAGVMGEDLLRSDESFPGFG